ncbi:hypothetical protein HGG76_27320 [Ochrobactrum tritici]|uniref:Lipoprotein n=1 Tax=Brucella tritici TaxID=94626 RepID=A0A7X6FST6_9HYPH|nr:hypothetical protein [Brucella tritici]
MKFKGAALIPLAFLLAGCFDMQQSMSINEDGTTALDIDLSVLKSALAFAEKHRRTSVQVWPVRNHLTASR